MLRRFSLAVIVALLLVPLWPIEHRIRAADEWVPAAAPPFAVGAPILLDDGRVLAFGQEKAAFYDAALDRWTTILAPPFAAPYTILLLKDGRLCLLGEYKLDTALYDPRTDRWTIGAARPATLLDYSATVLADGRLLVAGGTDDRQTGIGVTTAILYDPVADRWIPAGALNVARDAHTATLLPDGRVFVTGGFRYNANYQGTQDLDSAETYDPRTNIWMIVALMSLPRARHSATLLPDGRVLIVGGYSGSTSSEIYDPATNRWSGRASTSGPRLGHLATLLADGRVMVINSGFGPTDTLEFFDVTVGRWSAASQSPVGQGTPLVLRDGRVLLLGARGAVFYLGGTPPTRCFPQTGYCVGGEFLDYWERHGGLALNGYPISDPLIRKLDDGRVYRVQYFERVRLEAHPEMIDPQQRVQLGQFGRSIHGGVDPAVPPREGATYFAETGHNLTGRFGSYWELNGGLAQFGYPLTEEIEERIGATSYRVQYFERARFEYHPENATPNDLLLGQFGREILVQQEGQR